MDALEIAETGPRRFLPLTERRHLRGGDGRSGRSVEVLASLRKPLDERSAGRLARRRRCKENLLQHCVSLEGRITKVPVALLTRIVVFMSIILRRGDAGAQRVPASPIG